MRTLLIDNYDSFTFNLFQLISELSGTEPLVIKNDQLSWADICRLDFTNIVISPGPGRPERAADFGVSQDAILDGRWPLLGVCLGHQGICHLFGGRVVHAPQPMHGRISEVRHDGSELFFGIPSPFKVVRYHSLLATDLPDCLIPTAWTDDGLLMGIRHADRPIWGVQFHPESICTEHGSQLLSNFLVASGSAEMGARRARDNDDGKASPQKIGPLKTFTKQLQMWVDPDLAFRTLYARSNPCFWLDSSAVIANMSRYSFMGDTRGPLSEYLAYNVVEKKLNVKRAGQDLAEPGSIFDYLERQLAELRIDPISNVPFDFAPGYVGYFGYEMKAETGAAMAHINKHPDAQFLFADRVVCFDHREKEMWLVCCDRADNEAAVQAWFETTEASLASARAPAEGGSGRGRGIVSDFQLRSSDDLYRKQIAACLEAITDGESYEICLTNRITATAEMDDLEKYLELRRTNPAPYSAFFRFDDLRILCSSPERFIRCGRDGKVDSKPIKGTTRRGRTPEEDIRLSETLRNSEKERAENLMIVDLIRNDMGRVCEVGSVSVPSIFSIESYATLHQLVSTVVGRLRQDRSIVDLVRAMFPGGSMTGAPKIRTMEIIDRLEGGPRGVYSGALGYLSLAGTADLNIVIRTMILDGNSASVGAGGAITALSDPSDELDEARLKASAVLRVLGVAASPVGLQGERLSA